jgi:uncharacterized protein (TIGR03066 family)
MKALCAVAVGLAMCALAGAVRADEANEAKLVGKWEVTKTTGETPVGTVVEFAKGGALTALLVLDGKEVKLSGKYSFDGKKLSVDLKLNEQQHKHEFGVAFKGEEIELEDAEKKVDTLKRK